MTEADPLHHAERTDGPFNAWRAGYRLGWDDRGGDRGWRKCEGNPYLELPARPQVVTLCGSTRFFHEFQVANFKLTMQGKIVLSVGFYAGSPDEMVQVHGEGVGITPDDKVALDDLHKRKIDLSDRVLVLNVEGYVGESTRSEIAYAEQIGCPIDYLEVVHACPPGDTNIMPCCGRTPFDVMHMPDRMTVDGFVTCRGESQGLGAVEPKA